MYRPPAHARELAEQDLREATPEYLAELDRRAGTPDDAFSFDEALRMTDADEPPPQ